VASSLSGIKLLLHVARHHFSLVVPLLLPFLFSVNLCWGADRDWIVVTGVSELNPPNMAPLWRVYSDGTIETLITIPAPVPDTSSHAGSKNPLLSPDKSKIAFVRDDNLWIYGFDTGKARPLTTYGKFGKLADGRRVLRKLLITSWSPDGSRILFVQTEPAPGPSLGIDPPGGVSTGTRDTAVPVKLGFHVFDISLATATPVAVDLDPRGDDFIAWLPNGEFLLCEASKPASWLRQLVRLDPKIKSRKPIAAAPADYNRHQTSVSNNGQWLLAAISDRYEWQGRSSQVVKVNLVSGEIREITKRGDFTEHQFPRLSPQGLRIAHLWRTRFDRGTTSGSIVVDGRPIYPYTHWAQVYWINEKVLVIKDNEHLAVVDVDSTKVLAQRMFK
jgi:hypothetical protein